MVHENQTFRSMTCYSNILIKLEEPHVKIFDDTWIAKPLTPFSNVYAI